jgi:hypothetical protein
MSYAMFHAHVFAFPEEIEKATQFMRELGYDPDLPAKDPRTPEGLGKLAAEAVIAERRRDGSNHLGDEIGSSGGPFSDYTYYHPVNPSNEIVDPNYWQPIEFTTAKGKVTPGFLTPHWYRVKPYALTRPDQFRAPPPPRFGSDQLFKEVKERERNDGADFCFRGSADAQRANDQKPNSQDEPLQRPTHSAPRTPPLRTPSRRLSCFGAQGHTQDFVTNEQKRVVAGLSQPEHDFCPSAHNRPASWLATLPL